MAAGVALGWVLNTESGARWVADRATGMLGGRLEVRDVRGKIAGPLTAGGVRYHDAEAGLDVRVESVSANVALSELLRMRLHVLTLNVAGADVRLTEAKKKEEKPRKFSLEPPLDILLDRFTLQGARVVRDGKELFVASTAEAIGSWTAAGGITIRRLIVDSPQGNVHLTGEVEERQPYDGRATGAFRWKQGDTQYAGELNATSTKQQLSAQLRLSAPFAARLDATLAETKSLPWSFRLSVPAFDPRKHLLRKSEAIASLSAALRGEGNLGTAEVRGEVAINKQPLRIQPLRVRLRDRVVTIENLTLIDPAGRGTLTATGDVRLPGGDAEATLSTLFANLLVEWKGVELPKEWVGQPLATHGEVKVKGSPATFDADGQLSIGPPGHLADVTVSIAGTPEQIDVKRLAMSEKTGNLTANGTLKLKPALGWQFSARATRFDPGTLLVDWPGSLGFELDTEGQLTRQGPNASFDLKNLAGELRGRSLTGHAALTLSPDKVVAGNMRLRSGKSVLELTGRRGKSMNIQTGFDVASLDDWLPGAAGRLKGQFHIAGTWPRLSIEGAMQGRDVALDEYSLRTLDVTADVKNPQSPTGTLRVKAREIRLAGFEFSSAELNASGDEHDHSLHFEAQGRPLSTELRVRGARQGDGWAGSIEQLTLAASGIDPLALREPAKVTLSPPRFSISRSCLAGNQVSACFAADRNEAGELHATYVLEHLPLGLIAALAMPDSPLHIEAVIEGSGDIRRTRDGALFGSAQIGSASGRISQAAVTPEEDAADVLLAYENLKLDAQLAGDTARGTLHSNLGEGGNLQGEIALANLRGASPSLDGSAKLVIADLSPVGLFVSQLAELHGRGEASVQVGGTVADPRIIGTAELSELSAEVPQVGIKLHDGALQASMNPGSRIALTGKVSSGDGQLTLNGQTTAQGALEAKVQGKDFVAANIPGAMVVVAPDLDFARTPEGMTLGGRVLIPRANIDLTKLPRQSGVQQASPDVVVIDDEAVEQSKSVPLEARITVVLGKDVSLIGYGLDAKMEGQLVVHEARDEPTTGSGEIRLAGTYKAYGQDLTIEQGRLLFAGQAINNPQVNLVAIRTVDTVKARLTVTGSAQRPQLAVSADPAMSPTQALSYLVAGKPLNEIGSGEGDVVHSAALSLGGAAGNFLAKGLGKRLGISDIGVESSSEIGGSAFTVGEYLSPRLYLSYGVGLFEPGQIVTLRYRVSDKVSVEATQGPLSQRAGINYRIEK